jgi:hypothetical protein
VCIVHANDKLVVASVAESNCSNRISGGVSLYDVSVFSFAAHLFVPYLHLKIL